MDVIILSLRFFEALPSFAEIPIPSQDDSHGRVDGAQDWVDLIVVDLQHSMLCPFGGKIDKYRILRIRPRLLVVKRQYMVSGTPSIAEGGGL